jgi:hypothetical protein
MGGIRRLKQGEMNLGPVSYLDCIVFCVFLAPQLVWRVGFFDTVFCVLQALPFVRMYMHTSCCLVTGGMGHLLTGQSHRTASSVYP